MMRILVVDDSKAMRMMVIRILRQTGLGEAEIVEAANGAEGLAAAQATLPDLILSDWNMPEMSGLELLEALRASGSGVTFGFVTSESTAPMREKAMATGAQFLIGKPFTAAIFDQTLTGLVRS